MLYLDFSKMFRFKYSIKKQGLPTHDKEGKQISKGLGKKLKKMWDKQKKDHEKYLKSLK